MHKTVEPASKPPYHRSYFIRKYIGVLPGPNEVSVIERCPF